MGEVLADGGSPPHGGLHALAARQGAYRWTELRLFALTGRWAGGPGLPDDVRVHLFEVSAQHAWRADLWAQRLPVLTGIDPDALTVPRGRLLAPLLDALETLAGPAEDGGAAAGPAEDGGGLDARPLLAGLYRVVLPRLVVAHRQELDRATPISAGPTRRALRLVLADEEAQWEAGEGLLEAHLRVPEDFRAAAAGCGHLEEVVAKCGAGAGLDLDRGA